MQQERQDQLQGFVKLQFVMGSKHLFIADSIHTPMADIFKLPREFRLIITDVFKPDMLSAPLTLQNILSNFTNIRKGHSPGDQNNDADEMIRAGALNSSSVANYSYKSQKKD